MDYLKSFTIGTSGLITFQHFAPIYLIKDNKNYNFPIKLYSILAPIYYGLCQCLLYF